MTKIDHLTPNTPGVVAEVIDGELVAINLDTGCYYHANFVGSRIWELLTVGISVPTIAAHLASEYQQTPSTVIEEVTTFCQKLLQEKLVKRTTPTSKNPIVPLSNSQSDVYQKPALKKHEDMKELLLLDPIHDVGEKALPLTHV